MKIPLPAFNNAFGHGHHDRAQPEVQFYFDIVCPYAYLASRQLPSLCEELGALIDYRPILLGGVLKALESEPAAGPAAKTALTMLDVQRWAVHLDAPLTYPAAHPRRTVEAMRLLCWAPRLSWPRLIAALYAAYWAQGRDIADIEVLADIAESVGIDRDAARRGIRSPEAAQSLRRRTDEAIENGVFGVPTFVVEGHAGPRLFFGQDRLHFVREALLHHPLFTPPQHTPASSTASSTASLANAKPAHILPSPTDPPLEVANEARKVTFFYDFASPFAYLASTQIEALAERCGAIIDWQPILLGGLFRTVGTPMVPLSTYPEAKRRHSLEDMARWAHHYGEPFHFPSRFPMTTVTALRLALLSGDRIGALSQALFRAYWSADEDLEDPAALERALKSVSLPVSLLDRVGEPAVKEKLRHNTDEAARLGVFGVPSFRLAQHHGPPLLFFGQDRLLFVEKALRDGTATALSPV